MNKVHITEDQLETVRIICHEASSRHGYVVVSEAGYDLLAVLWYDESNISHTTLLNKAGGRVHQT